MFKLTLFYVLFIFHLCVGKKNNIKLESEDVCSRCKILTDSFNFWFEKTTRGKYEGGDAAWEEAKLKSYARSEIRLVEIQENLCSELTKAKKDQCYALNEEVEQLLDTWWGFKNTEAPNLYTWLCIENLKYCCPKNHFGAACKPCPIKNDKTCNGHGICSGGGIRQGSGTCLCSMGYKGVYCDECDNNYFRVNVDKCEPCHKACIKCNSSSTCFECAKGWVLQADVCTDINECNEPDNFSVCKTNEFCVNNEGSYLCRACDISCKTCTVGPLNCSSCDVNEVLIFGKCINRLLLQQLNYNALIRISVYIFLMAIVFFMFQQSILKGSMVVLCCSIVIYYIENTYELSILSFILKSLL